MKRSGDSESPWNIPLLMLIGPVSRTPWLWTSVIRSLTFTHTGLNEPGGHGMYLIEVHTHYNQEVGYIVKSPLVIDPSC